MERKKFQIDCFALSNDLLLYASESAGELFLLTSALIFHLDVTRQVRSGQVRSGQVRSGQVRSGQVRSGQVRSGQVRSCRVGSGQVGSGHSRGHMAVGNFDELTILRYPLRFLASLTQGNTSRNSFVTLLNPNEIHLGPEPLTTASVWQYISYS